MSNETPKIYVACLAAYNNAHLHGRWIDVTQGTDAIYQAVREMLQASPMPNAEEWAIHDYEGFGSVRLSEWEVIERVAQLAEFIAEYSELGCALLARYDGNLDAAKDTIADYYIGCYQSLANYVQEMTEETTTIPGHLVHYIDYEAMAHDILLNGDVFIVTIDECVHIFWN